MLNLETIMVMFLKIDSYSHNAQAQLNNKVLSPVRQHNSMAMRSCLFLVADGDVIMMSTTETHHILCAHITLLLFILKYPAVYIDVRM